MIDALGYVFFNNALIIGALASIACGIIGTYIVVKRISFISASIAHSALGGVGIGYYFGISPIISAGVFCVLSALGIGAVSRHAGQREDTIIGAMWAIGMSVGLMFIYLTPGYAADLFSFLFGNILMTSVSDIMAVGALDIVIVAAVVLLYNAFLAITFDEEYATILNLPVTALYLLLLCLIALAVVVLIRVVGIILVIALLSMPAAAAELLCRSIKWIMALAVAFCMVSVISGVFLSFYLSLPAGPLIVFSCVLIYTACFVQRRLRDALGRGRRAGARMI